MNCPKCGKENPDDAQLCQSCSNVLTQSTVPAESIITKTSGIGIASMVLGILSVFTLGITAIPAVILGIISLIQIEKSGGRLTGRAFGIVGIAVPVVVCFLAIGVLYSSLNMQPGKGAVCKANLRELGIAWIMYADDNDGKIVNGHPSVNANGTLDQADDRQTTGNRVEIPWARGIEIDPATGDPKISRRGQEQLIKNGTLWPYVKNTKVYRCPDGKAKHLRTYSIVCSLNGDKSPVAGRPDSRMLCVKHRSLVRRPHTRIVFMDIGWSAPGSYGVYYDKEKWWDPPPVRHEEGITVSFADGHSEYWKWKGEETIKLGKIAIPTQLRRHVEPKTVEGKEDLQKVQKAVWGKLGYNPSAVDE